MAALTGWDRGALRRLRAGDAAIDGTSCELEFAYSLGANANFTFTAHAVYLPVPRIEIPGPRGIQSHLRLAGRQGHPAPPHVYRRPRQHRHGY